MPVSASLQGKAGSVHFSSAGCAWGWPGLEAMFPDWQRCCHQRQRQRLIWVKKCHGSPEGLP
ncbi:hypothetical protein DESPIG_02541 [Desulfovibrio piger ATCC 29098]|uniref:Uncharacterized protein n=1 Tax=Desulfovibrio piger ATCC 29098 TaxID=411464 RepID=B6WWS2_9BACT|nr:hypothetical protein DESPIG_02541 [Desulfovibrio piger ATCC 29098]